MKMDIKTTDDQYDIVSLITARGGSKGIPNKNLIECGGMPLIYHSIFASKNSKVEKTFVSTNDPDIQDESLLLGADSVVVRPENISTDESSSEEALIHFLKVVDFNILVFIQPTSPMITVEYINKGIDMILSGEYDSVFSVTKEHWVPRWSKDIKPINWNIDKRPRRQEVEETYIENGMFYITTKEQLSKSNLRYGGRMGVVEIPLRDSFQIDTYEDLKLVEELIK
tara:strand:+ start:675 stop:1352 length:678 start_codon:yes stop_codon:yes gene_type:complete